MVPWELRDSGLEEISAKDDCQESGVAQTEARTSLAARILRGQPIWLSCGLVFACSFFLRASLVLYTGQYQKPEFPEPAAIAQSIVQTGVFGNPYKIPTGATAHAAPFLPFLLSGVFRLFGTGPSAGLVEALLSITACSLQYALLPLAAQLLGWPARVGTVAGLFGALFPFRFWLETKGTFEHTYAGLALLVTTIMTLAVWRSGKFTLASGIARGAVWAITLHISASLLPVCLLLLAIEMVFIQSNKFAQRIAYVGAVCGTIFVLLVPWTARNYAQFGKLFYMRDNLGLELAVSNRDDASPLIDQNMGKASYRHPNGSVAEALKVKQLGEIAYNKERMQEAKIWIRTHPAGFLQLTLERVWYFWFPLMQRPWQRTTYAVVTVLGLLGTFMVVWRKQRAALILLPILLAYPLIYYLIESSTRYRYPMDWTVLLLAAYAVCSWFRWGTPAVATQTAAG
jgi:hypothetical protein